MSMQALLSSYKGVGCRETHGFDDEGPDVDANRCSVPCT